MLDLVIFTIFSMLSLGVIIVSFIVGVVGYLWFITRKPRGFPPGPPGWPIIGNALQVDALEYVLLVQFIF